MMKIVPIAASATLVVACLALWGTHGWITRQAYAVDQIARQTVHEAMPSQQTMASILTALETITITQKRNRDEWVCKDIDEEILDLKKELAITFVTDERIDVDHKIKRKNDILDSLECSRFMME